MLENNNQYDDRDNGAIDDDDDCPPIQFTPVCDNCDDKMCVGCGE